MPHDSIKYMFKLLDIRGLLDYRTTKFENDANRPSCFQQLQSITDKKNRQ